MSIEIEKKYRLSAEQLGFVEQALLEEGAEYIGEDAEENVIFGGGVLETDGAVVRIRRTQNGNKLTYKRRILNDLPIKQQIEHESEVGDPDEVAEILGLLGLKPRMVYEKRRRTWRFRSVEVVLDELPFGQYMEIEGPITGIAEAEMLLGIEHFEPEHETYPRLTARLGTLVGDVVEARFTME
jgi:adenylate cyclase class 2